MSAGGSHRGGSEHCDASGCVHPCAHEQAARDSHPSNGRAQFGGGSVVPVSLRRAEAKITAAWRRIPAEEMPSGPDDLVMAIDSDTGWHIITYGRRFGGR